MDESEGKMLVWQSRGWEHSVLLAEGACRAVQTNYSQEPPPKAPPSEGLWLWEGTIEPRLGAHHFWDGGYRRLLPQEAVVMAAGHNALTESIKDVFGEAANVHPKWVKLMEDQQRTAS